MVSPVAGSKIFCVLQLLQRMWEVVIRKRGNSRTPMCVGGIVAQAFRNAIFLQSRIIALLFLTNAAKPEMGGRFRRVELDRLAILYLRARKVTGSEERVAQTRVANLGIGRHCLQFANLRNGLGVHPTVDERLSQFHASAKMLGIQTLRRPIFADR